MPLSGQKWDPERLAPRPPLAPFAALLAELAQLSEFPAPEVIGRWVEATRDADTPPLRFVEPPPKPRRAKRGSVEVGELYDARITRSREVPCLSSSYHDLFNALMFKAFPRAKRALHARQYEALQGWAEPGAQQLPGRRTREQDALTLFDEGGSVVVCPTQLAQRFAEGAPLPLSGDEALGKLVIFGHALVEHLSEGQTGLRSSARVLFVPEVPDGTRLLEWVDAFVTRLVEDKERFRVPDADAVVFFGQDGAIDFRLFDAAARAARISM